MSQNAKEEPSAPPSTYSGVPSDTEVSGSLHTNVDDLSLDLVLSTQQGCVIKGAVLFAEHVFQGESLFCHSGDPKNKLVVPLRPKTNNAIDMLVKVRGLSAQ